MKFVSKSSNLLVVLKPGLSAQPITGTPAQPTVSVRFHDGIAEVKEEDLIERMLNHPGFDSDFIALKEEEADPYEAARRPSEPAHEITELKHGTPVSRSIKGGGKNNLPPQMQKLVEEAAKKMALEMLPSMMKEVMDQYSNTKEDKEADTEEQEDTTVFPPEDIPRKEEDDVSEKPKKRRGRPPKAKKSTSQTK